MSDYEGLSSAESEELNFDNESDDSSSEEEVLPVYSESEPDDEENEDGANISESDINDSNDDDMPDPRAWGKNKRLYYNGDNISDKANKILSEEHEEAMKLEEEEARAIQKRLVEKIDDADLTLDLMLNEMIQNEEKDATTVPDQNEKVEIDLSKMSDQEKLQFIEKESPELLRYIQDFKELMACVQSELLPVIKILKKKKSKTLGAGQFIELYNQLIMNYCTNIVFYVLLKSRKTDVRSHPSRQWLDKYKSMIDEARPIYEEVFKPQIKLIMRNDFSLLSRINQKSKFNDNVNKSESRRTASMSNKELMEEASEDDVDSPEDVDMMETDVNDENAAESKRPITYQIAKNKGLTPHRKKELRNPRVKHRMKYRKAKIRRKGQVREVRKEVRKYDGEISGIKANVVKSVKFKV